MSDKVLTISLQEIYLTCIWYSIVFAPIINNCNFTDQVFIIDSLSLVRSGQPIIVRSDCSKEKYLLWGIDSFEYPKYISAYDQLTKEFMELYNRIDYSLQLCKISDDIILSSSYEDTMISEYQHIIDIASNLPISAQNFMDIVNKSNIKNIEVLSNAYLSLINVMQEVSVTILAVEGDDSFETMAENIGNVFVTITDNIEQISKHRLQLLESEITIKTNS